MKSLIVNGYLLILSQIALMSNKRVDFVIIFLI